MSERIDAERWRQIRAAFDDLAELAAGDRVARLDALRRADPDLAGRVSELLAADSEVDVRLAHIDFAMAAGTSRERGSQDADPLGLEGRTVSHFRIGAPLATGGMGVVYRAEDTHLHRTIALKFPLPAHHYDRATKERFLHEARSVGALDHPNICSIYEAGETDDGHLFLAMPLYDGETLKARIAREGALDVADTIRISKQIADGLAAAHDRGIVHRDIKPANVMLLPDGSVKVLDFGLAKVRDLSFTASTARIGTVSYMAPEQIEGRPIDARVDLWALGVMLYEMLTGQRPFGGDYDVAVAHSIVHSEPRRISEARPVPAALDELASGLLQKNAASRRGNAANVAAELAAIGSNTQTAFPRAAAMQQRMSARALSRIGIGIVVLVVIATSAWLIGGRDSTPAEPRMAVVLPFIADASRDSSDYLPFAVGDAITNALARLQGLVVPSNITTDAYAGTAKPHEQIGRELSAAVVVSGSVRRAGDRIRLGVSVFDTLTKKRAWSEEFEGPLSSAVTLARDAALAVAEALDLDLSDAERSLLVRLPTTNAEAYDLYLRGRELELRGTPLDVSGLPGDNLRNAQALYTRARDLDPDFALARARLALMQMYSSLQYDPTPARREQARLEAEAAVRSQPDLPEAHEALAYYWGVGMRDYNKSNEELKLALQSYPNSAEYHLNLGTNYRGQGRWQEAVAEYERAMQLEPRNPGGAFNAAMTYSRLRRYAESVAAWDRAIALAPDMHMPKIIRGHAYTRFQGTVDTLEATLRRLPPSWDPRGMTTYSRFMAARYRRRQPDALTALNASKHDICIDSHVYRPRTLLRGQVYDDLGEKVKAAANYEAARALLSDSLAAHPDDVRMLIARGLAYAGLGRNREAVRDARRAMDLAPVSSNHLQATAVMGGAAEVFIAVGQHDDAIQLLELLLGMAAGREVSVPLLRNDPIFDPLRKEPRFAELIARYSTN